MAPEVFIVSLYPGYVEFVFCHIPRLEYCHCTLRLKYSVVQFSIVRNIRLWMVLYTVIPGHLSSQVDPQSSCLWMRYFCCFNFRVVENTPTTKILPFECFVGIIRHLFAQSIVLYETRLVFTYILSSGKTPILVVKNIKSANLCTTECEKFLVARLCLMWSRCSLCICKLLHNWKLVPKVVMDSNFIESYNVIIFNYYTIKLTCNRVVLCFLYYTQFVGNNELVKRVITCVVKSCNYAASFLEHCSRLIWLKKQRYLLTSAG